MDYTSFEEYPIRILGIDESYNEELTAIETLVKNEIGYAGDAGDVASVLPYFVFFKFLEDKETITNTKGESYQVAEFSFPSAAQQIRAWNIGVKMLNDICTEKVKTANKYYLSKINLLC